MSDLATISGIAGLVSKLVSAELLFFSASAAGLQQITGRYLGLLMVYVSHFSSVQSALS
jgi:hypothetical protein